MGWCFVLCALYFVLGPLTDRSVSARPFGSRTKHKVQRTKHVTVWILEAESTSWTRASRGTHRVKVFVGFLTEQPMAPELRGKATHLYLYFITYQRAHGRLMIQWHLCQTCV